ncbi:MAG: hypothetical protein ACAI25_00370 [Planctomycetota bacterium]
MVLLFVLLLAGAASACPGCREAVKDSQHGMADPAAGFSWSIYLMIAVPYLTLGGLGFAFWRAMKKHQRSLDMAATSCDSSGLPVGVEKS